jgi:putative oxidoreductase
MAAAGSRWNDLGLAVIRAGAGAMFIAYGWPKITAGPELWQKLGGAMGLLGITFLPAFWGFMAAVSEFVGGIFQVLGVFVRPFSFLMAFTMFVAMVLKISGGANFYGDPPGTGFASPLVYLVIWLGVLISGGGRMALGRLGPFKDKWFA